MRVFVTGATGFVGSVVVQELMGVGYTVLGLARSDAGAASVTAAGALVHRGSLEDLDSLRRGAAAADGTIHTAFIHDFSQYAANAEIDRLALEAMAAVLEGSGKPLISTSGLLGLAPGGTATEDLVMNAARKSEDVLGARGIRASTIRLPPSVYGGDKAGFVSLLIATARAKGVSAYVGDGRNRWPAVHRRDAAHLYRLVLEKGVAGARYHAVGDAGVAVGDIAEVIGKRLNLPVVGKTPEEAVAHFGFVGMFAGMDSPASAAKTQKELGWAPKRAGLIADLENGRYFES